MKKTRIYAVIGIFILSFICHFVFDFFPCVLTSIFFPVNESIWEHMKILFTATLLYGIIDHVILTKKNISFNNFSLQLFASAFLSFPIFLIIYLPVYYLFEEFLPLTLTIMLITYIICQPPYTESVGLVFTAKSRYISTKSHLVILNDFSISSV